MQGAATCATTLAETMGHVPERPPADGSGSLRAEIVAALQRADGRTDGLAEAVSHGVAFHHAGAVPVRSLHGQDAGPANDLNICGLLCDFCEDTLADLVLMSPCKVDSTPAFGAYQNV